MGFLRSLARYYVFWILLGLTVGLGAFLMHVSNFTSYLSDNPKTCMNCHIMGPEYITWSHSAHREVATCNDCHVPQNNVFSKYWFKAMDGLRHATLFTLRKEAHAIMIKDAGKEAVMSNCVRCHSNMIEHLQHREQRYCWECHRETPHGKIRSLTSAPFARVPTTDSMIPAWLNEFIEKEKIQDQNKKKEGSNEH